MSPWGFIRRRNQPLSRGLLRTHYNGRVIGSSIVATNPHTTDDGFALTLGGSIPRGTREHTFWQGDGTDNIAYARTTRPYVITTGSENQPCTFVVVFKMQTTGISNTSIAGLGAQTGTSGSTLFRLMGGTAAANLYLQVQDGGGTIPYNTQLTTPVAVNDLRWHTAVVTFDMVSGGNARCYVDGVAPSAGLNYTGGNFTANTTFDYVSVCGIIRGGSPLAYGPFDVALFVPMFGAKLSDQEGKDLSANPWQLFRQVADPIILAEVAGGGPITVTVNQSNEADSAQVVGRAKSKAIGISSETDAALAIAASKRVVIGIASETESAFSVASAKSKTLGMATETDTAFAVTLPGAINVTINQVFETDLGQPIARSKRKAVGIASETNSAQTLARLKARAIAQVQELCQAMPITAVGGAAPDTPTLNAADLALITTIVQNCCNAMLRVWINKMITDPVAGTWTIYADDNATPMFSGPLYEDAAATQLYRGRGAEHRGKNIL